VKRTATVLLLSSFVTAAAAAQSRTDPNLIFSISGGLTTGRSLWSLPAQPQPVVGSGAGVYDTLSLGRVLKPGLVAGLAGTYFTSPNFGWTAEVSYFGIASEQRCTGPNTYVPDTENINQQACDRANGVNVATSVVGFLVGATARALPQSRVHPFVRATIGAGLIANSYVQTSGIIRSTSCGTIDGICGLTLLDQKSPSQFTPLVNLAAGISFWVAPAYRVRFEARDIMASLPVVTGNKVPTAAPPYAPTGRSWRHVPTFLLGVDIVLERGHSRRY